MSSGAEAAACPRLLSDAGDRPLVIKRPIIACLMRSVKVQGKDVVHAIKKKRRIELKTIMLLKQQEVI